MKAENKLGSTSKKAEPFLRWAGGKAQLLKKFEELDLFPKAYNRYFEPFVGGGAVFFHLHPKRGVLSDLNEDLINCYKVIKKNPKALIKLLEKKKLKNNREAYYKIRNRYNDENLSRVERAATLIYLNRNCFNGLYRVNNQGKFNVPIGENHYKTLYKKENIYRVSDLLKHTSLTVGSFENTLKNVKKGDFVYLDPPYDPIKNLPPNFTNYTKLSFLRKEQKELAKIFRSLDKKGVLVMMSNSNTRNIRKLYRGFRMVKVPAKRLINCDGKKRGLIKEIVVLNY